MTRLLGYLEEALASLWRNRMRSALTMLGMIIGSASIIAVFGISKAATSGIANTLGSFGVLPVYIVADPSQDYPDQAQIQYRDAATIAAALGDLAASVQPGWQRTALVVGNGIHDYETVVSDGDYHTDSLQMVEGRKLDTADISNASRVAVLTQDLGKKYFPHGGAVGNILRVKGQRFSIAGVYADIKGSFMNSLVGNSSLSIPYTALNTMNPGPPDFLLVYPTDPQAADRAGQVAVDVLKHIHGARSKYVVQNGAEQVSIFNGSLGAIGAGLSAIGGVALIVAGIGIMNIMLVSVTERTREIGIRKAIGASKRDIIAQFLMESVLLSLFGGGIGMALGLSATIGAANLLSHQLGEMLIPYLLIVSIALIFSFLVGTVFGTYPALRAAQLDPIEALRS